MPREGLRLATFHDLHYTHIVLFICTTTAWSTIFSLWHFLAASLYSYLLIVGRCGDICIIHGLHVVPLLLYILFIVWYHWRGCRQRLKVWIWEFLLSGLLGGGDRRGQTRKCFGLFGEANVYYRDTVAEQSITCLALVLYHYNKCAPKRI